PAKSMPSRKCLVLIEMMPGTMISSDSRKNQLRRPTMSRRRTFGGSAAFSTTGAAGSSASGSSSSSSSSSSGSSSSGSCVSSAGSSTVDSKERGAAEAGRRQHDGQQVVGHDDRRDEAGDHPDAEHDGETFHGRRADEPEDHAGDQRRSVRVTNGGPRAADG